MGSVVGFPIFLGCHAAFLGEDLDEVALGGKRQVGRNLYHGKLREAQKVLGLINLEPSDIVAGGFSQFTLEQAGDIAGGIPGARCQILQSNPLLQMGIDIVQAFRDGTGQGGVLAQ